MTDLDLLHDAALWKTMKTDYAIAAHGNDWQDPYAATRRAIVRAAAEIGKATP